MNGAHENGGRNKTLATIITIIVVAAIFLFSVLAGFLSDKLHLYTDMTNSGLYTLSEDTKQIIDNLDEDIRMYVLMDEPTFRTLEASELLDEYVARGKGKISLTYVDPLKEPNFTSKYNIIGEISNYSVIFIVESDKRYKIDDASNMYGFLTDTSGVQHVTSFNGESLITSSLLYVTKDELPLVSFVANHDEYYSDSLRALLDYNGFSVEEVNLMSGDISPESKLLFISSPLADFTAEEIQKLENYFNSHRDAIVIHGLSGASLPRFEIFMREWGIGFSNSIIFDPDRAITEITQFVPYLENTELTKGFDLNTTMIVSQAFRPIELVFEQSGNKTVTPILSTSYTSFARPLDTGEFSESSSKVESDISGPFNVATLSTMQDFTNDPGGSLVVNKSEILTIASSPFILDTYMTNATIKNSEFISSAITYFIGQELDESGFYVTPKSISAARLQLYGDSVYAIMALLVAIPVAVLVFGFVFWLKRRHL